MITVLSRAYARPGAFLRSRAGEAQAELRSGLRYASTAALYLAGYVFLDWISFIHEWSGYGFTLWNPPPALSLALIVTCGMRYAPLLFPAAFLADYAVRGLIFGLDFAIVSAALLAAAYAAVGAALRRHLGADFRLGSVRDVVILLVGGIGGAAAVAALHICLLEAYGLMPPEVVLDSLVAIWIGDATGIVTVLPALLLLLSPTDSWRADLRNSAADFLAFAAGLIVALWLIHNVVLLGEVRPLYLLFLPVIWIAMRRGFAGAALSIAIVQAAVVISVQILDYPVGGFIVFQTLGMVLATTGLLLGSVVTARQKAELRLRAQDLETDRVARVAAVGVMGSALAHDLSQPLASTAAYAKAGQMLLRQPATALDAIHDAFGMILAETDRAGQTLRHLRDVVATGQIDPRPTCVDHVARKVIRQVRREPIAAECRIVIAAESHPAAMIEPAHLELILLNILRNAAEATSEASPGGTIVATIRQTDADAEVVVDDSGPGVPPHVADRLFEPFATTKPNGMGLGLLICRRLLDLHGGTIRYAARAGGGARFVIRVPLGPGSPYVQESCDLCRR